MKPDPKNQFLRSALVATILTWSPGLTPKTEMAQGSENVFYFVSSEGTKRSPKFVSYYALRYPPGSKGKKSDKPEVKSIKHNGAFFSPSSEAAKAVCQVHWTKTLNPTPTNNDNATKPDSANLA